MTGLAPDTPDLLEGLKEAAVVVDANAAARHLLGVSIAGARTSTRGPSTSRPPLRKALNAEGFTDPVRTVRSAGYSLDADG
jgi:hypothetical protein